MSRWVWVACCVLVAAVVRLNAATGLPMDADEPIYLESAEHYALGLRAGNLNQLMDQPHNPEHPALVKLVHGVALLPLGEDPDLVERLAAVRTVQAAGGVTLAGLLALVHPVAGLVAALHTLPVKYTSQGYLEAWPMVFMFLGLLAWNRARQHEDRKWALLLGLALGATAACKLLHVLPGLLLLGHLAWARPRALVTVLPVGLLSMVGLDPGLWADPWGRFVGRIAHHASYTPDTMNTWALPFEAVFGVLTKRWHPDVLWYSPDLLLPVFGLAGCVLGLVRGRADRPLVAMVLAWYLVGLSVLCAWPTRWAQHALILIVPIALGTGWLARFGSRKVGRESKP